MYLPPYSPDHNPIEEAFARRLSPSSRGCSEESGARSREALVKAMGVALEAITVGAARGFFGHRRYRVPAQSLMTDALVQNRLPTVSCSRTG
jgi:hypothetical protein